MILFSNLKLLNILKLIGIVCTMLVSISKSTGSPGEVHHLAKSPFAPYELTF